MAKNNFENLQVLGRRARARAVPRTILNRANRAYQVYDGLRRRVSEVEVTVRRSYLAAVVPNVEKIAIAGSLDFEAGFTSGAI